MSLITHCLVRSIPLRRSLQLLSVVTARNIQIKIVPPPKEESHGTRNRRLGRFFSPHLSIYKPQLTSLLSISNRGTSIVFTLYTWAFGIGALLSSQDNAALVTMIEGLHLGSISLFILKFSIAFPLIFHTCAGIRHLIWDTGSLLKLSQIYMTGYALIGGSLIVTAALAAICGE